MATTKEIKNHIKSISDTRKITNAMYLIASTKLRKAKAELDSTRPYFSALQKEIRSIFQQYAQLQSPYFSHDGEERDGKSAYLVITADKGLAGAYNQNVIKKTVELISGGDKAKLYVVGEYGRHFFSAHNIPIEKSFLYTAQNPSIHRAREIGNLLLEQYNTGAVSRVYIIYTDMKSGISSGVNYVRLLPFRVSDFHGGSKPAREFEFHPSPEAVLDKIIPSYFIGYIYGALVDSFCCEQNARMNSMDSANKNAEKLLDELYVQYNHIRQSSITQEITEISAGVKAMNKKER